MAGLAAAWELSRPEHRDEIERITLYERRPWLGGKAASVRGVHGRIEEHGLHVWPGYYDNAFRLIREVYDELNRERADPTCPIKTWRDAFVPADLIGAASRDGKDAPWIAHFSRNHLEPGDPQRPARPLTIVDFVARSINLVIDAIRSLSRREIANAPTGLYLSTAPNPRGDRRQNRVLTSLSDLGEVVRLAELGALVAAVEALALADSVGPLSGALRDGVLAQLGSIRDDLDARLSGNEDGRRMRAVVDLVITMARGMVADGLLAGPERLATIDHLDFRAWLVRHGARHDTAWSPLVNAMYDFVFAYEDGDPERPAFSAGLGIFLASKLFFEYRGSLFWKLHAGMGDAVMLPLYEALRQRGVEIELGWELTALRFDEDRAALGEVLVRQVTGADGSVPLRQGEDFDDAVLAVSLGALPQLAGELIETRSEWREMVRRVRTVATHAVQTWLSVTEDELGWPHHGATVSGWRPPFDTYASMTHLLQAEDWPADGPRSVAYFCAALPETRGDDPATRRAATRAAARELLADCIGELWPGAVDDDGFRWELLHGGFDAQYFSTNDDPSDRYVQSLPGTGTARLRADESGCAHLVLAGDWINSGLNAGCIEAAVISGHEAANAVLGRPLTEGVSGSLYGLSARAAAKVGAS